MGKLKGKNAAVHRIDPATENDDGARTAHGGHRHTRSIQNTIPPMALSACRPSNGSR